MKYPLPVLAAVLAVLAALVPTTPADAPQNLSVIKMNGVDCPPEGTATSVAGKALNRLKNRFTTPTDDDIDPHVSLPAMLAPGDDRNRFNSAKAATIQGYIVRVSLGGILRREGLLPVGAGETATVVMKDDRTPATIWPASWPRRSCAAEHRARCSPAS